MWHSCWWWSSATKFAIVSVSIKFVHLNFRNSEGVCQWVPGRLDQNHSCTSPFRHCLDQPASYFIQGAFLFSLTWNTFCLNYLAASMLLAEWWKKIWLADRNMAHWLSQTSGLAMSQMSWVKSNFDLLCAGFAGPSHLSSCNLSPLENPSWCPGSRVWALQGIRRHRCFLSLNPWSVVCQSYLSQPQFDHLRRCRFWNCPLVSCTQLYTGVHRCIQL